MLREYFVLNQEEKEKICGVQTRLGKHRLFFLRKSLHIQKNCCTFAAKL